MQYVDLPVGRRAVNNKTFFHLLIGQRAPRIRSLQFRYSALNDSPITFTTENEEPETLSSTRTDVKEENMPTQAVSPPVSPVSPSPRTHVKDRAHELVLPTNSYSHVRKIPTASLRIKPSKSVNSFDCDPARIAHKMKERKAQMQLEKYRGARTAESLSILESGQSDEVLDVPLTMPLFSSWEPQEQAAKLESPHSHRPMIACSTAIPDLPESASVVLQVDPELFTKAESNTKLNWTGARHQAKKFKKYGPPRLERRQDETSPAHSPTNGEANLSHPPSRSQSNACPTSPLRASQLSLEYSKHVGGMLPPLTATGDVFCWPAHRIHRAGFKVATVQAPRYRQAAAAAATSSLPPVGLMLQESIESMSC